MVLRNGTTSTQYEPTHQRGSKLRTAKQPPDLLNDEVGCRMQNVSENYPTEGIVVVEKQSVKYKLLSTRHYDENVT